MDPTNGDGPGDFEVYLQDFTAAGMLDGTARKIFDGPSAAFWPDATTLSNGNRVWSFDDTTYQTYAIETVSTGAITEITHTVPGASNPSSMGPSKLAGLAGGGFVAFYAWQQTTSAADKRLRFDIFDNSGTRITGDEFVQDNVTGAGPVQFEYDVLALSGGAFSCPGWGLMRMRTASMPALTMRMGQPTARPCAWPAMRRASRASPRWQS